MTACSCCGRQCYGIAMYVRGLLKLMSVREQPREAGRELSPQGAC